MNNHLPAPGQVIGLERIAQAWSRSQARSSKAGEVYTAFICNQQGVPVSEATLHGLEQLAAFTADMVALGYAPQRYQDDESGLKVTYVQDLQLRILMREY